MSGTLNGNIMVFLETDGDQIAEVSCELLSEAGRLAARLGLQVEGIAVGHGLESALADLGKWGCKRVHYTEDPRLKHFTSVPYAKAVAQTIRATQPRIVLYGASTTGRDVAPRVASELRCGLTADCTSLAIGDWQQKDKLWKDILYQIRPAFGGNIIATIVSPESVPSMATVREGVMKLAEPVQGAKAEVVRFNASLTNDDFLTEVLEVIRREKGVNLKAAQVIVTAGMGVGDAAGVELCRELAETVGAALAGSRPVVDSGLLSKDHQVGQTGTTVRPNLYIACGISGQIQHLAGMKESRRIIAINSDPDAPILKVAHYAIVGDLRDVLPKMIRAYKRQA